MVRAESLSDRDSFRVSASPPKTCNPDFPYLMNPPPTSPARPTAKQTGRWLLEIVRGRDVGRTLALDPGETVVGNALNGQRGLDLVDQEGSSPRRMAGRHAAFACSGHDLSIQDLESPGGTFVNQQRLLSGQPRKLSPGDVIQLGGVQLKVKQDGAAASPAAAPVSPASTKTAVESAPIAGPPPRGPQPAQPAARTPERPTGVSDVRGPQGAQPSGTTPERPARVPDQRGPQASSTASGGRLPTAFTMAGGAQCRTWDDFLILSAQSWTQVRDELVSGRLVEYLRRIGRPELIPHSAPDRSADDRLDDWLARVPAAQASAPELDVHPQTMLVQAKMGGGMTRLSLRITNVGFRLLRSSVRVEPADSRWVKLLSGGDGRPFQTIDQTEIPVELELPETIEGVLRSVIVIESNGGTRRVEVRVERPQGPLLAADPGGGGAGLEVPILARELRRRLARVSPLVRIAVCCGAGIGLRLLAALMNKVPLLGSGSRLAEPRIISVAILTVAAGFLCGLVLAKRLGEPRDLLTAGLAGGLLGLLASAPWFSMLQTIERIMGPWSTSIVAVCLLWGALGALLALGSTVFIAHQTQERQVSP
jgi:FHA domain-containing protein